MTDIFIFKERLDAVTAMNTLVKLMNNENAYLSWIEVVPDHATSDDLICIADDDVLFADAVKLFEALMLKYGAKNPFYIGENCTKEASMTHMEFRNRVQAWLWKNYGYDRPAINSEHSYGYELIDRMNSEGERFQAWINDRPRLDKWGHFEKDARPSITQRITTGDEVKQYVAKYTNIDLMMMLLESGGYEIFAVPMTMWLMEGKEEDVK